MPKSKYRFLVEVVTRYLPDQSDPKRPLYSFAYTITITNVGDIPAQLISRHWVINDAQGNQEEIKGLGVVGNQPLIAQGEAFQYTSGCQLRSSSGTMHGSYFCVAEDGERFETEIPLFMLDINGGEPRVLH